VQHSSGRSFLTSSATTSTDNIPVPRCTSPRDGSIQANDDTEAATEGAKQRLKTLGSHVRPSDSLLQSN
jgi:hypothetical protein